MKIPNVKTKPALSMGHGDIENYWRASGLDRLFAELDMGSSDNRMSIELNVPDLVRLHKLIRDNLFRTTLEFGVGFSTVAIAHALLENEREVGGATDDMLRPDVRFKHWAVDANAYWLERAKRLLPKRFEKMVTYHLSSVRAGTHLGQLCHYYEVLPNVVPQFFYLDGPDPKDVKGDVNGLNFGIPERTVMAADLLLMEPTFFPGTLILVDGRSNNARFLERNFTRPFKTIWSMENDVTLFHLDEPPLGSFGFLTQL